MCIWGEHQDQKGSGKALTPGEMESAAQAHGLDSEKSSCDYPIRPDKGQTLSETRLTQRVVVSD